MSTTGFLGMIHFSDCARVSRVHHKLWNRTHSGKNLGLLCFAMCDKLHSLDRRSTTSNDKHVLAFHVLAVQLRRVVDVTLELLLSWKLGHLRVTTRSNSSKDTVKLSVRNVIDDPTALSILADRLNLGIKICLLFQPIAMPDFGNLFDNLLAAWVAFVPEHRGEEAVHDAVDLESRSVVDFLYCC